MRERIALLVAIGVAIGLWLLAAFFFNSAACSAVDERAYPVFVKTAIKNALLLCCIDRESLIQKVQDFLEWE